MSGKIGGNIVRPYVAETWSAVYDCCCPKLSLRSVTDASIVHLSIDSVIEIPPRRERENETIRRNRRKGRANAPGGGLSVAIKVESVCFSTLLPFPLFLFE